MIDLLLLLIRSLFGGARLQPHRDTVEEELEKTTPPTHVPPAAPTPAEAPTWGSANTIAEAMKRKGYRIFDTPDRHPNLNIVGVRNTGAKLDQFGCQLHVFWREGAQVRHLRWAITTYPGSRYLVERLLNPRGAAILCPGQWKGYRLDTHNGKYRALCQRGAPVKVYRDGDRDREFDLDPDTLQEGFFGINIHAPITPRSGLKTYLANLVGSASAGCQVFQRLEDFLEFRSLCERAAEVFGNSFTYTLLLDTDLQLNDRLPIKEVSPFPIPHDQLESWEPDGPTTTGVRNRNLLNVKGTGWLYSEGVDERGHHRFPTFAKGLRAGIITLRSYRVRHRLNTIYRVLSRWAPVTDTVGSLPGRAPNNPGRYATFVADRLGIEVDTPLDCFDAEGNVTNPDRLFALVSAMAAYENYAALSVPRSVFDEALRLL